MTERRGVVVASADRLFAECVARLLRDRSWDATTAADGVAALASIRRARPDAVLVLGGLPRLDAPTLARQIHRRWSGIQIVTVGQETAPGARVLPSSAGADEVAAALTGSGAEASEVAIGDRGDDVLLLRTLTRRELAILRLLARGLDTSEIARSLGISVHTVRTHLQNLYAKLGCHSRLEVVRMAARHGLLEGGETPRTTRLRERGDDSAGAARRKGR